MSVIWREDEKCLLRAVRPYLSTEEIVEVFKRAFNNGRTAEAITKKARQEGIGFVALGEPVLGVDLAPFAPHVLDIVKARENHLAAIQPPIPVEPAVKSKITSENRKVVASILEELHQIRLDTPRVGSAIDRPCTGGSGRSVALCLSDIHMGQEFADPMTGQVLYNSDVAIERLKKTPELLFTALNTEWVDEIVLLLIGDMVTGEGIFPHQEMYIDNHAVEQVRKTTKALWQMVNELRKYTDLVRMVSSKGNHGRTMSSPEANWDNIVYQELELLVDLDGGSDLSIKNRYGDYNVVDVRGWKGMIRHTAPIQADTAAGIAKYASWGDIHNWDFFCFGHYHHWGVHTWNGKPIFRNGSLVGGDDFSETLAKMDNPVQLAFTITDDTPAEAIYPLYY